MTKALFSGDVAIAGGGLAGLTLSLALHKAGVRTALVDALPLDARTAPEFDGRASALAYTSWRMLEAVGAAEHIGEHVQRIEDILVVDGRAYDGLKPGGPGWRELESAPALVAILARRGLEPVLGRLVTADHIVCGRERSALRETGADIVDMESAALAQGAAGRPFAVVRVVLDTPAQGFASPSFLLDGFRALRKLGTVLPALEDWAAGCAHRAAAEPRPPIRRSR